MKYRVLFFILTAESLTPNYTMSSALHLNITPASPLSQSAALQVQVAVVRIRIRVSDLSRPTILFSPLVSWRIWIVIRQRQSWIVSLMFPDILQWTCIFKFAISEKEFRRDCFISPKDSMAPFTATCQHEKLRKTSQWTQGGAWCNSCLKGCYGYTSRRRW